MTTALRCKCTIADAESWLEILADNALEFGDVDLLIVGIEHLLALQRAAVERHQ